MELLDIGEVSAQSGVKPSALRYYEEAGLISSVARHGLRRQWLRVECHLRPAARPLRAAPENLPDRGISPREDCDESVAQRHVVPLIR